MKPFVIIFFLIFSIACETKKKSATPILENDYSHLPILFETKLPTIINISTSEVKSVSNNLSGFLHGFNSVSYDKNLLNYSLVQNLKPIFWRIGLSEKLVNNYNLAKSLNSSIKINLVVSDILVFKYGDLNQIKPWLDWNQFETDIETIFNDLTALNIQVDYWDIWNEPDWTWSGTCDQALEMYQRASLKLKSISATAKVVGPSVTNYYVTGPCTKSFLESFIDYDISHSMHYDAISWHEFEDPTRLPDAVAAVKSLYQSNNLVIPEIHITEYSGPTQHPVPAYSAAWFYYFELANVNWISRACWNDQCLSGLNGLFQSDNMIPNNIFWIHRYYSSLELNRLTVQTSNPKIIAIASIDTSHKKFKLIVSRFEGINSDLDFSINLNQIENGSAVVKLQNIQNTGVYSPMTLAPENKIIKHLPIENNTLTINFSAFKDGDVYLVDIEKVK